MNKPLSEHPKLLLDPYLAWCDQEGAPITEDFGIDLLAIPTAPWPRFGVDGAIAHLKGRGDFVSIFVLDLAPGAQTSPQKPVVSPANINSSIGTWHYLRFSRRVALTLCSAIRHGRG